MSQCSNATIFPMVKSLPEGAGNLKTLNWYWYDDTVLHSHGIGLFGERLQHGSHQSQLKFAVKWNRGILHTQKTGLFFVLGGIQYRKRPICWSFRIAYYILVFLLLWFKYIQIISSRPSPSMTTEPKIMHGPHNSDPKLIAIAGTRVLPQP